MGTERSSISISALRLENPFSLKVAQVFTGFGIGCGVGIGVGRPIYLGAIPAVQQVLMSARGATDAFSGVGRHVNSSLMKLGFKNIEVGIGCGVGVGHGFGVGLALKPGVVNRIQNSFGEMLEKAMITVGNVPVLASIQGAIPSLGKGAVTVPSGSPIGNAQVSSGRVTTDLKFGNTYIGPTEEVTHSSYASKEPLLKKSIASHTERVINSFLHDPLFKDSEMEVNETAENLDLEKNVLKVLLAHQRVIGDLIEENQRLQQILVEDLKIPPSKLQMKPNSKSKAYYTCSDCFECRRRRRKAR
ncbi:uncharacterized protein LOC121981750 [Zingiber officinale]|uniref:uncharacterized protein LOC121981750 n=1 Tax=Zingiber officinale TaxID=94328 RepID=UPI001C4C3552|nr:uncharacterized protein LOC121981750 [Zingiber officinale]